jgi:uncharacterized repeat protein (TIGR01451 family)
MAPQARCDPTARDKNIKENMVKFRIKWLAGAAALVVLASASAAFAQGGTGGGTGIDLVPGGGGGTAAAGADLQITGSASTGSPTPGSAYFYTFQIKNSGPDAATDVVFTDPVPAGTNPNYATSQGSVLPCALVGLNATGGTNFQCNVGTIFKGGQANVVVNVTAPQTAAAIVNTATVTSATPDPKLDNNAVTVSVAVKAPTGGVCKGGVCDTVPAPVGVPCAILTSVTAPVGYYSVWAAIWNTFTLQSCSTGNESLTIQVTETNVATGSVDYNAVVALALTPSQNFGMVLDNDFAPFNITYAIAYTVRDSSGTVLSTASATATTPAPR